MASKKPKIHFVTDSRESSVSCCRQIYDEKKKTHELGAIVLVGTDKKELEKYQGKFGEIAKQCENDGDVVVVSMLAPYLELLQYLANELGEKTPDVILAAHKDFEGFIAQLSPQRFSFYDNPRLKRTWKELERRWIHYRLSYDIIAHTDIHETITNIINGAGKSGSAKDNEYSLKRFWELDEPVLAGGTYGAPDSDYGSLRERETNRIDLLREYTYAAAQLDEEHVLLIGEMGTGKESIAWACHDLNEKRRHKNYITINCAHLDAYLFESQFFGHKKGTFTGAEDRDGLIKQAEGGSLFLDELHTTDPVVQGKLLRLLQERKYRILGTKEEVRADVRFIAAAQPGGIEQIRPDLKDRFGFEIALPSSREIEKSSPGSNLKIIKSLLERKLGHKFREGKTKNFKILTPKYMAVIKQKLDDHQEILLQRFFAEKGTNSRGLNRIVTQIQSMGDYFWEELETLRKGKELSVDLLKREANDEYASEELEAPSEVMKQPVDTSESEVGIEYVRIEHEGLRKLLNKDAIIQWLRKDETIAPEWLKLVGVSNVVDADGKVVTIGKPLNAYISNITRYMEDILRDVKPDLFDEQPEKNQVNTYLGERLGRDHRTIGRIRNFTGDRKIQPDLSGQESSSPATEKTKRRAKQRN